MDGLLTYGGWGDWCPPAGCRACWTKEDGSTSALTSTTEDVGGKPSLKSENSVIVSSFYYISELRIVAEYAGILGKTADQAKYAALAEAAGVAFNKHFYNAANKTYDEKRTCGEYLSPQTKISLAAALDLIPPVDYDAVIDTLVDDVAAQGWHLNVGIVGIKYLLPTLSAAGRGDVALMIAQVRTPPSYIYMVEQGATTLWETWTGTQYQPVASRNHIMFGSNSDWYYKFLAGITMAKNTRGWQQLVLRPEVWNAKRGVSVCANLSSTEGSIDTPRGIISAAWSCLPQGGGGPAGTCAEVAEKGSAHLRCSTGVIKSVDFASYGTPKGSCASGFSANSTCSAPTTKAVVEGMCVGKPSCLVPALTATFGADPCWDTLKQLAVKVTCGGGAPPPSSLTPVFEYSVVVPTGSTAQVVLPQFGSKAATVAETAGAVWKAGAYVPGVSGVTGASVDTAGNVAISTGSGAFTFTVYA